MIDHTLLKPEATPADIERLCKEATIHKFAAVCVNPVYVRQARDWVDGSSVKVATVAGFPLGAVTTKSKVEEAAGAIANGASEVDMVMAVGLFKGGEHREVGVDIGSVVEACRGWTVKVILETSLLTPDEITTACKIAVDNGADFVKTSTGFGSRGATVDDIRIMKEAICNRCKIKASGGIRTREQAIAMIEAGASRLGTSAGVAIVGGR
jgi:deoxyribose-phosphate aldolase